MSRNAHPIMKQQQKLLMWCKKTPFDIGGRYISHGTVMTLAVYWRKHPSFYVALNKQYSCSQNNADAAYWHTVFWSVYRQNMKGLIFYLEMKLKVINPDKEKERRGWELVVGREVKGRIGCFYHQSGDEKKSTVNETRARGLVHCSKL